MKTENRVMKTEAIQDKEARGGVSEALAVRGLVVTETVHNHSHKVLL